MFHFTPNSVLALYFGSKDRGQFLTGSPWRFRVSGTWKIYEGPHHPGRLLHLDAAPELHPLPQPVGVSPSPASCSSKLINADEGVLGTSDLQGTGLELPLAPAGGGGGQSCRTLPLAWGIQCHLRVDRVRMEFPGGHQLVLDRLLGVREPSNTHWKCLRKSSH